MPSGCEFICKNEECEHVNKGFAITAPWPVGQIELLINAPNVIKKKNFRDGLIKLKNEGRKFACITYPNEAEIETEGYRVTFWSEAAKCVWQYDVFTKDESSVSDAIDNDPEIPNVCPKSGGELLNFTEVVKAGIPCPHCNEKMQQSRWYSNEI